MTDYNKYQHVKKFGTIETDGIEYGECFIFPKIDGTNGVVFYQDNQVQFGSRRFHLKGEMDNQNFRKQWFCNRLL